MGEATIGQPRKFAAGKANGRSRRAGPIRRMPAALIDLAGLGCRACTTEHAVSAPGPPATLDKLTLGIVSLVVDSEVIVARAFAGCHSLHGDPDSPRPR